MRLCRHRSAISLNPRARSAIRSRRSPPSVARPISANLCRFQLKSAGSPRDNWPTGRPDSMSSQDTGPAEPLDRPLLAVAHRPSSSAAPRILEIRLLHFRPTATFSVTQSGTRFSFRRIRVIVKRSMDCSGDSAERRAGRHSRIRP